MDVETTIHKSATLKISFDSLYEAKNLHDELTRWAPSDGWSDNAIEFFQALANIHQD